MLRQFAVDCKWNAEAWAQTEAGREIGAGFGEYDVFEATAAAFDIEGAGCGSCEEVGAQTGTGSIGGGCWYTRGAEGGAASRSRTRKMRGLQRLVRRAARCRRAGHAA